MQQQHSGVLELIRDRVVDPELAALVWLLVERGVPLVVAAPDAGESRRLAASLLGAAGVAPGVADLSSNASADDARAVVRDAVEGHAVAAVVTGERLEDVIDRLSTLGLSEDEQSMLGVVVVVGDSGRVVAAHYLRPVARDVHGHVQRLPPAVLAAFEPRRDGLEHFAWGVLPELGARIGRSSGELEVEQAKRRDLLARLAADGQQHVIEGGDRTHRPNGRGV